MDTAIHFDPDTHCFTMRLRSSFYALRVLDDGQVVHVDSGPLPPAAGEDAARPFTLAGLDEYEDPNYVWEQQARRWELPAFGDVTYHDVALKAAFPEPHAPLAPGESPHLPVRDLRLRYAGHEIRRDAAPGLAPGADGPHPRRTDARETLCVRLQDTGYDFGVTLFYRITPEHDIIERWLRLENRTAQNVAVESLAFGTLHVPNGRYEVTRTAGAWAREFIPVRQGLEQGRMILEGQGLNTGHAANPFFLLSETGRATEDAGDVHFGALAYSGNWSLRFEVLPTEAVRVHGGYEPSDFSLTLEPGGTHTTPAFVHGCCAEGWGGASRRLHRFTRDYVLPAFGAEEFRPVLYNSWEAVYFGMSLDSQTGLARKAAEIGVELFCVDDGWFGGRRSDRAGLGDWVVSPDVFPGGLAPLIAQVLRLGMRFGLWVEPEMVNPDSDLYRAHPDWVLHFPGRPRTEVRNQLILDFGRPEVVEHIFGALDRLVAEHDISFFKWDMNRYATESGSAAGRAVWRRHVEGVYGLMDRLRRGHPHLEIQSCSGGGGRVDLGILARADQVWTSDNTDAYDRVPIQDGFSLAYPPRVMESWVTHARNHQTGRTAALSLRFDVAMRGALGIGTSLNELSPQETADYRRRIAFYKRLRPVAQGGDLYRLTVEPGVSVWQTVLPDGSRSVYSIVVTEHLQGVYRPPSRLRGLTPNAVYEAVDESGLPVGRWSGLQLMTVGLPGDTVTGGAGCAVRSRTLLLEAVA